jgi:hypothetical protein
MPHYATTMEENGEHTKSAKQKEFLSIYTEILCHGAHAKYVRDYSKEMKIR